MHENTARQAQVRQQREGSFPVDVPPGSVDEALALAMQTGRSNSLVAVIEQDGKRSYFVVRAGRGGKLNEAAAKKGGIALMRSHCVRASWEKPEQIQRIYEGLPPELKTKFLESRGFDFRVFTAPEGWSIYLYTILFGSGEKWQGEGIAHAGNVKPNNRQWQDSTAETRAFSRTVGRGTGEGLLPGDQLAGSGDLDDFDPEAAEGELLSEEEAATRLADPKADIPVARVQAARNSLSNSGEAGPDGPDPFRTPGGGGPSGDGAGPADADGGSPASGAASGVGDGEGDEPFPAGGQGSNEHDGGHSSPDGGEPSNEVSLSDLIEMAKARGIYLLKFAQEEVGLRIERLSQMSDFERSIVASKLQAYPEKVAR